jgi:hypothetical protein
LQVCFHVCDSAGQKLAFVYFEEEPGRRAAAKLLTKDEARRIAANIAKLPKLLRAGSAAEVTTAAGDSDIISLAGSIDPAA